MSSEKRRRPVTEAQIRATEAPWAPEVWLLRTMILEPERICDPVEKKAWLKEYYRSRAIVVAGRLETLRETVDRLTALPPRRSVAA